MSKYILSLTKLKGEGRSFSEGAIIDLSSELSLAYEDNVNRYKSVHHPFFTQPMRIGNTSTVVKTNQQALLSGIFSSQPS